MNKIRPIYLFILFWLLMSQGSVFAQRIIKSYNDGWSISYGQKDIGQTISLPHTFSLDAYQNKKYARGIRWYKKTIGSADGSFSGRQYLKFDGINSQATVYIDNQMIARHDGGYTAFVVDVTSYFSDHKQHLLSVRVDNSNNDQAPQSGDFTIFGGIYRNVWLIHTSLDHISFSKYGAIDTYVDLKKKVGNKASLVVSGTCHFDEGRHRGRAIRVIVSDRLGHEVARGTTNRFTKKTDDSHFNIPIDILDVHCWSPREPYLYQAKIELLSDAEVTDNIAIPFGVKTLNLGPHNELLLNGKSIKLMGVSRHQDKYPFGIAVPSSVHRRDMELIKELGCNFVRLAHYPQDEEVLRACDELGLLVWEEIPVVDMIKPDEAFYEHCKTNMKEMIAQHKNHPSIAIWGIMNEILLQAQRKYKTVHNIKRRIYEPTIELARALDEIARTEDPSRLTAMACHESQMYNTLGLSNIPQVVGWNLYNGWYTPELKGVKTFLASEHEKYPRRSLFVSEYGAGSDKRIVTNQPLRFDFSPIYQQEFLEYYIPYILKTDYLMGGAIWNMFDFSSASREESMPRVNNKGLMYSDRTPKDVFYYVQSKLRHDIPIVHLAVDDWKVRTIQSASDSLKTEIKIYSNLPYGDLYIDDIKVKTLTFHNAKATWTALLSAGNHHLYVKGYDEKQTVSDEENIILKRVPMKLSDEVNSSWTLAINVGSRCGFIDFTSGLTWVADQVYKSGSWGHLKGESTYELTHSPASTIEINQTTIDPIFQSYLVGLQGYHFDVPNGDYQVSLYLAELSNEWMKQMVSDNKNMSNIWQVLLNGNIVEQHFSVLDSVGYKTALIKTYRYHVTDGHLNLDFIPITGYSYLNGIVISKR